MTHVRRTVSEAASGFGQAHVEPPPRRRLRAIAAGGAVPSTPPRWAKIAAHAAALTPLPSALWRVLLVLGWPAGYTAQGLEGMGIDGWGGLGVLALSLLSELAALLTLGLVQPWGRVVPRWLPFIGGRCVPRRPVVALAAVGAVGLVALWTPLLAWWSVDHAGMTSTGATVVGILYLPLVAWGPLLAAVTVSYARSRP